MIILIIISIIVGLTIFYYQKNNKKEKKKEIVEVKETDDLKIKDKAKEELEIEYKVDIKGAINVPGIYSMKSTSRVIDQTTPNMIQKLNLLFARKPLISKEI